MSTYELILSFSFHRALKDHLQLSALTILITPNRCLLLGKYSARHDEVLARSLSIVCVPYLLRSRFAFNTDDINSTTT